MEEKSKYFDNPVLMAAGKFIGDEDRSFYIPAYQRPFSWNKEQINRLFEDIVGDIEGRMIPENGDDPDVDTVSFIGSILCYRGKTDDIYPRVRNQVPTVVLSVVDGQQRLTVLIMSFIILHNYIRVNRLELPEGLLKDKCTEVMKNLSQTFKTVWSTGNAPRYPKMIRAFSDQWSSTKKSSGKESPKYFSPLSYYSSLYANFLHDNLVPDVGDSDKKFDYSDRVKAEGLEETRDDFNAALRIIKKHITNICESKEELGSSFPHAESLVKSSDILNSLLNVSDKSDLLIDFNEKLQCRMMRAVFLSAYIMRNVYLIYMVTNDENYAFEIFDSLNTTGIALTAYETFIPSIMSNEGLKQYRNENGSKKYIDAINEYLEVEPKKRAEVTKDLLITFALAEDGTKLSKKLPDQRKYLISRYEKEKGKDEQTGECKKKLFVHHLMHASDTWRWLWAKHDLRMDEGSLSQDIKEARFCLCFLKEANHTMSLALIIRFYESVRNSKTDEERIQREKELCGAIKAIAAFFAIWLSSRKGTDGIDKLYRNIMGDGVAGIGGFNRKGEHLPDLKRLQKSFCYLLQDEEGGTKASIKSVEDWVRHNRDVPIYRTERTVAKFVLMTASHSTEPDQEQPGFIKKVPPDVYDPLISPEKWGSDDYKTSEHIIPQSYGGDTKEVTKESLHRIGNLTILPASDNSILGARLWSEKKSILGFLSSKDEDELKKFQNELPELPEGTIEKLRKTRYLPMARALSLKNDFSYIEKAAEPAEPGKPGKPGKPAKPAEPSDITKRGENILCNSWLVLSGWLNFPSGKSGIQSK